MPRMARAALGDQLLYQELADDPAAIRQAVFVVFLVAGVHGLGQLLAALYRVPDGESAGVSLFLSPALFTLIGWFLTAFFTYTTVSAVSGTSASGFLGGTFLQFVRSVGFTASPGLLLILTGVPVVGSAAFLASTLWMATAMIIAVKESLNCSVGLAAFAVILATLIGRAIALLVIAYLFAQAPI